MRQDGKISSPTTGILKLVLMAMTGSVYTSTNSSSITEKQTYSTLLTDYYLEKGKQYDIKVEFYELMAMHTLSLSGM
jgi:beta-glucosidase